MEKNKKIIIGAVIVDIILVGITTCIYFRYKGEPLLKSQNSITVSSDTQATSTGAREPESTQDTSPGTNSKAAKPSPAVSISYNDALRKYADRRIQLDKECQAYPNTVTYKDNTGIMIDNRSPKTRTVKVGETYTIKPYGFKIVTLPDVYLKSKTILVDCDKSQNVATILVQE